MKKSTMELNIDRIGSQKESMTAEEEKALGEFFKNLKLKYQMERESEKILPPSAKTVKRKSASAI